MHILEETAQDLECNAGRNYKVKISKLNSSFKYPYVRKFEILMTIGMRKSAHYRLVECALSMRLYPLEIAIGGDNKIGLNFSLRHYRSTIMYLSYINEKKYSNAEENIKLGNQHFTFGFSASITFVQLSKG